MNSADLRSKRHFRLVCASAPIAFLGIALVAWLTLSATAAHQEACCSPSSLDSAGQGSRPVSDARRVIAERQPVRFHSRKGLAANRSIKTLHEFDAAALEFYVNGEKCDDMYLPFPQTVEQIWTVEDREPLDDDRDSTLISRKFVQAAGSLARRSPREQGSSSVALRSRLEGVTVAFSADCPEGVHLPHSDAAPENELERVREDLDFRAILPGADVANGSVWAFKPESLLELLEPYWVTMDHGDSSAARCRGDWSLSGDCRAELIGPDLESGDGDLRVALTAKVKISYRTDLWDCVVIQPEVLLDLDESREIEYELSGALTWNQDAGCVRAIRLNGSLVQWIRARWHSQGGDVELSARIRGEASFLATAEPWMGK